MEGYGLSSLGPTVGLSGLPDPMGDATAQLEARRRQQVTDAGYPGAAADATNPFEGILSALGPTINERAVAAREAMRRGDMATANALNQSLALDFGQFLGSIKPIRAYHGSPHDFDRFDMSKIGTGEGGQAYGHGLYFAENEGVARSYRAALAKPTFSTGLGDLDRMLDESYQQVARQSTLPVSASDAADLVGERLARQRVDALKAGDFPWFERVSDMQIALDRMKRAPPETPGRMYEVDIHADPSRFLDWDKPLSGQNASALAALKETGLNVEKMNGREGMRDIPIPQLGIAMPPPPPLPAPEGGRPLGQIYSAIERVMGADRATAALRDAGIPGIKYLDAGSRSAGDGSRNYVVFDDKIVEILRKYGIMAPVAGAGLGSLSLGDEEGM